MAQLAPVPSIGMGIGSFYTQALSKDFSRDFQMRVINIGPNNILKEDDNVFITTAVLPGYAIANQAVPFMGVQFNVPGSGNFPGSDAWAVTFRCDAALNIREKLIGWQRSIFNSFPSTELNSVGSYGPKGAESTISLVVMNRSGGTARGVRLVGAYPVAVGEISYDATLNGNVVTLGATLAYQYWTADMDLKVS